MAKVVKKAGSDFLFNINISILQGGEMKWQ